MALLLPLLASGCSVLRHADDPAPTVRGPIPSRIQQPVKLTHLAFRPRRAAIEPKRSTYLSLQEAYSSIFEVAEVGGDSVSFDGEISRTSLIVRRALAESADLEIEVPVVYASSGFLDEIVEEFHDFFGFQNGGREDHPQFEYEMEASHDGTLAYRMEEDQLGLGDIPLVFTHAISSESATSPAIAWRAGIELPTGSESRGFGNGKLDFGAGLLGERSFGRWTATAAADWVYAASSDGFESADVDAFDGFDVQLGVEYRWNDRLSLLAGAIFDSPSTHDIDLDELESASLLIDVGASFDLGDGSRLLLDFGDDAISRSGPDFTLLAAWSASL